MNDSFIGVRALLLGISLWSLGLLAASDSSAADYRVETLAQSLHYPWSLAQLPDGSLLITEKSGRLVWFSADLTQRRAVANSPEVAWIGQGGLLDVQIDPRFGDGDNRWIYLSYSTPCATGFTIRVSRYRLVDQGLEEGQKLFEARPCGGLTWHFAGRMAFDDAGKIYLAIGDRGERDQAQSLAAHHGTVVRLHADGRVPADNPFVDDPKALPEIYSYGHRNPQGMTRHPITGALWLHEHGPQGGDELNRLLRGANYGWPQVTHGREYSGGEISEHSEAPGIEPPRWHWTPSIAPSGLAIYSGAPFEDWHGQFLVGALKFRHIQRLRITDDGEVKTWIFSAPLGLRIRDVRVLADGLIYALTDDENGQLLRLSPSEVS